MSHHDDRSKVPTLSVDPQNPAPPDDGRLAKRAAVFRAPGFPTVDAPTIDDETLRTALGGIAVDTATDVGSLVRSLDSERVHVLVLPYGSAFPIEAWPAIREFLGQGGGLVALGGAPFHQPVRSLPGGGFALGVRQPTFAHELLIGPADAWRRGEAAAVLRTEAVGESGWRSAFPAPGTVHALTVRLATRPDLPEEHGSEGPREGIVRPLVHVRAADGLPVACPLLEIDRLRGWGAGGRWVLAPCDASLDAAVIREAVVRALQGAMEIEARPVFAAVDAAEPARLRIVVRRPRAGSGDESETASVAVRDESGTIVAEGGLTLVGPPECRTGTFEVRPASPLEPGLYRAEVRLTRPAAPDATTTGFWVRDERLLAAAPAVTVSRDWLRRGPRVFPVVGTTYMASDVHRKFLFEPNPAVWEHDFAEMARRGVNFVRTGIWTGWSRVLLNAGAVDEGVLRALDAYVLTAARHDIVVCFTFFAFLPPSFGGTNPYLDPLALEGQAALLTAVARRYRGSGWIHYDLINEPTYGPPNALWGHRPIGDAHERKAWHDWVVARHGDDVSRLRDLWRDPDDDIFGVPGPQEHLPSAIRDRRRPRKAHDFLLFSQEVVARWAARLRGVLKEAAGDDALVTLGQDEGGTALRPAQQLHAHAVDYTAIHAWWQNDDLLSTGVLAKVPEKPCIHQEAGLMRLEDEDGNAWRDPQEAARALERKFALGLAARGAGIVEWAWNINPYMPIDNESVIGFFRPDGTAKPELQALSDLAAFLRMAAPHLDDFEADPVVVVIPHSRLFLGRPGELEGVREVIRVLGDHLGVVPTALSDATLTAERLRHARLVIVPSAEVLGPGAAEALRAATLNGARLLVTGAVCGDAYGTVSDALRDLGLGDPGVAVRRSESTSWGTSGGARGWASFDRNLGEGLRRSPRASVASLPEGPVWHEPLPLDRARENRPLVALLTAALAAAGIETHPSDEPVTARVLRAPQASFVIAVNETPNAVRRVVTVGGGRRLEVPIAAGRARLVLVDSAGGAVLAATPGESPRVLV